MFSLSLSLSLSRSLPLFSLLLRFIPASSSKPSRLHTKSLEHPPPSDSVIRDPALGPPHFPGAERAEGLGKDLVLRREHPPCERRGVVRRELDRDGPLREDRAAVEGLVDEVDRGTGDPRPRGQDGLVDPQAVEALAAKGARQQRRVHVEHAAGEGAHERRRDELEVAREGDDVDAEAEAAAAAAGGGRARGGGGGGRGGSVGARPPLFSSEREELVGERLGGPRPQLRLSGAPGLQGREAAGLYPLLQGPGPASAPGNVGDDDLRERGGIEFWRGRERRRRRG